jgi:predicted nucleic acid-binding protein
MIFIDTGAFIARYLSADQYHHQALDFWDYIKNHREICFTSNFVLDETFTLLGRRAGNSFAVQRAVNIYASSFLTILRPDVQDELKALELFDKFSDQHVSFTDCISFILMRKQKIMRVFSFDSHFPMAGFELHPRPNFQHKG